MARVVIRPRPFVRHTNPTVPLRRSGDEQVVDTWTGRNTRDADADRARRRRVSRLVGLDRQVDPWRPIGLRLPATPRYRHPHWASEAMVRAGLPSAGWRRALALPPNQDAWRSWPHPRAAIADPIHVPVRSGLALPGRRP